MFFFSSRRRHTRFDCDWSSDVCSSDLAEFLARWRSIPAQITVPGGERLGDVAERAWNALTQIVRRHQEAERILVVSHNFRSEERRVGKECRSRWSPYH